MAISISRGHIIFI